MWLERIKTDAPARGGCRVRLLPPATAKENDLVVLHHQDDGTGQKAGSERARFTFPRQRRDRRLCLADYFKSKERYDADGSLMSSPSTW